MKKLRKKWDRFTIKLLVLVTCIFLLLLIGSTSYAPSPAIDCIVGSRVRSLFRSQSDHPLQTHVLVYKRHEMKQIYWFGFHGNALFSTVNTILFCLLSILFFHKSAPSLDRFSPLPHNKVSLSLIYKYIHFLLQTSPPPPSLPSFP